MRRVAAAVFFLALAGCRGGPAKQILGAWQPDPTALSATEASDAVALTRATLVFRPDKSFGIGDSVQGKYTIEARTVTLTTKKILGRDAALIPGADNARVGELSEDGKRLTITDPSSGQSVAFVKSR